MIKNASAQLVSKGRSYRFQEGKLKISLDTSPDVQLYIMLDRETKP